jgi:hypothetical protein
VVGVISGFCVGRLGIVNISPKIEYVCHGALHSNMVYMLLDSPFGLRMKK